MKILLLIAFVLLLIRSVAKIDVLLFKILVIVSVLAIVGILVRL